MTILYLVYAVLLLVGGALGFLLAHSEVSLLSSLLVAALMVVATRLVGRRPGVGLGLGLLCALVVGAFFVSRYAATHNPMPALPVIAFSAAVLIATLVRLWVGRRSLS